MTLHLLQSANKLFLRSENFIERGVQTLVIERSTTNISVVKDDSVIEAAQKVTSGPIFGVVGIMNILGINYLGVIENAAIVGTLNNAKIYKITNVNMVPFRVSAYSPIHKQPTRTDQKC